ncbi:MAG TPA: cupin domain-containing protein [Terracidiphilus sp.]|nr:cupin domain-containing protein [Terracidiphilus sp.]
MVDFSKEIWKELLPAEKEVGPAPANARRRKDAPPHADHWTPAILLERAAYLRKLAKAGDGQASETLKEYPQHAAMLSFRARDGVAELHENFADLFYVLDGRATLVTGGSVVGAETIALGEIRGASIEGGVRQELRAGDVAHVPAGVPHQMLVPGDKTFTSFVVKIEQ